MAKNTTPTENPHEKSRDTNTGPTFSEHIQQGWDKMHATLGTGGIVAVILALMLLTVIKGYDDRIDRLEGVSREQRNHPMMYRDNSPSYDRNWRENLGKMHDGMERHMEEVKERGNAMIRETMDWIPTQTVTRTIVPTDTTLISGGQYAGYISVDGKSFNYMLKIEEDILTGTLVSDNTDILKKYVEQLSKLHLDVTGKEGQIQFTGKSTRLGDVVRLLNAE